MRRRPRDGPVGRGLTTASTWLAIDRAPITERRERRDDARAGRGHEGLHLHGADHEQHVARLDLAALADLDVDDRSGMRALDGRVPGRDRQGAGRRRTGRTTPAPQRRGLLIEELQGAGLGVRPVDGFGQQGGARIAGAEVRMGEDGTQLVAVGRHADDVELVERPLRPLDRQFQRARGARLADQLGQQRIELRRRRQPEVAAGIDPHAGPRRLAIGAECAGARR